jgi:hypothetical protein
MAVMIIQFPKIEPSMKLAIQADDRLNTYAGAYGVDFATAMAKLVITCAIPVRAVIIWEKFGKLAFSKLIRNHVSSLCDWGVTLVASATSQFVHTLAVAD